MWKALNKDLAPDQK